MSIKLKNLHLYNNQINKPKQVHRYHLRSNLNAPKKHNESLCPTT